VDKATAANETVQGLHGAVGRIDDVVSLVEAIATQTKLLALNATITENGGSAEGLSEESGKGVQMRQGQTG